PRTAAVDAKGRSAAGAEVLGGYARRVRRRVAVLVALAVGVVVSLCFDLATGPSGIAISEVVRALVDPASSSGTDAVIVRGVRLPYALMALLVGAALSLAGAEMQTTLDNPLASPFTLGMSSAATFGAALAIVLDVRIPGVAENWTIS